MKILIAGDVSINNQNENIILENKLSSIFDDELLFTLRDNDLFILNLECPLTTSSNRIIKNGPHLKGNPKCASFLSIAKNMLVCLSNNHILDYGKEGLIDTINALDRLNLNHIGAGLNDKDISKVYETNNITIINMCEHEFSYESMEHYGANEFDPYLCIKQIQEAKEKNNYVILIYHGGKEMYQYPTPLLQKRCRNLVDFGADLIVCQHSHCIGTYETYKNSTIVYGQGNFIFGYDETNNVWNEGLLIQLDTKNKKIEFVPFENRNERIFTGNYKILNCFEDRSDECKLKNFVQKHFDEYCIKNKIYILSVVKGYSLNRIRIEKYLLNGLTCKTRTTQIENVIQCEPHRETTLNTIRLIRRKTNL